MLIKYLRLGGKAKPKHAEGPVKIDVIIILSVIVLDKQGYLVKEWRLESKGVPAYKPFFIYGFGARNISGNPSQMKGLV